MRLFTTSLAIMATAAALPTSASAKSGPTSVAYVEVNDNAIGNAGRYQLPDGSNAFDVAIIFAANVNYDGTKAVLYNNPQVQALLDDAQNQIRPLQAKGIKVLLSILGNHQGAGISNFQSPDAAADFAHQLCAAVDTYGLDGIDLDDEYADYGNNGTPQPNDQSAGWLISALRADMPDKLLTLYAYGPAAASLASADPSIGAQLDYAWNPNYGSYSAPAVPGLDNSRLGAAAVDVPTTSRDTAADFARRTVADGYGVYMSYDLQGGDNSAYVSAITQGLYGLSATYS